MPRIIKAVGQEIYVEGGPECPNGIYIISPEGIRSPFTSHGECPACRGTGVKPVSWWSDAEKAEWLAANCKAPLIQPCIKYTVITAWDNKQDGPYFLVEGEQSLNFSQALTAAVIEVAQQEVEK